MNLPAANSETIKYEEVYLHDYLTVSVAKDGLRDYFHFYNTGRPHASLDGRTPFEVYYGIPTSLNTDLGKRV